jgi:hypothetical protein
VPPEKEFGNSLAVNVPAVKQEKDGYAERLQMWKKKEAEAKGANPATPQPQTE